MRTACQRGGEVTDRGLLGEQVPPLREQAQQPPDPRVIGVQGRCLAQV